MLQIRQKIFKLTLLLIVSSVGLLYSCATFTSSSKGETIFFFDTEQEDLIIEITNKKSDSVIFRNKLPTEVNLTKGSGDWFQKADYEIKIYAENSKPLVYRLISDGYKYGSYFVGNTFLNIGTFFIGGTLGFLVIDPLLGSMFEWKDIYKQEGNGFIEGIENQKNSFFVTYDEVTNSIKIDLQKQEEFVQNEI